MAEISRPGDPAWLREAAQFNGLTEIIGSVHEPAIVGFFREAGFAGIKDDETAWCAAFMGAMLVRAGYNPSGSLLARSYLDYGQEALQPQRGDIVVMKRGNSTWQGHVTILLEIDGDHFVGYGGNQANAVGDARYPMSAVLGFRRPSEADRRTSALPQTVTPVTATFSADLVRAIQLALRAKNYHEVGNPDGDYGTKTRTAIMAFQTDHSLTIDGRPSGQLLEAILSAPSRTIGTTRATGTPEDSRIIEAADKNKVIAIGTAGTGAIALGREAVEQAEGGVALLQRVQEMLGPVGSLFSDFWPVLLIAAAFGIWWYASEAKKARIEDHRTGKTA